MNEMAIVILLVGAGLAIFLWLIYQKLQKLVSGSQELDEEKAKNLVNQVFGEITNKVIAQTKSVLQADKEAIFKDNENKRQVMERLVVDLKKEIMRQKGLRLVRVVSTPNFMQLKLLTPKTISTLTKPRVSCTYVSDQ